MDNTRTSVSTTRTITRTGLALALVVVLQFASSALLGSAAPLVKQIITGSLVNMMLALTVSLIGMWPGVAVGVLSSVLATLLGIGPVFPIITPFIAVSNAIYVVILSLIFRRSEKTTIRLAAVLVAAAVKTAFLWIAIPMVLATIPEAKPPQIAMMTLMFSWPQAITATIGGCICLALTPVLKKAIDK